MNKLNTKVAMVRSPSSLATAWQNSQLPPDHERVELRSASLSPAPRKILDGRWKCPLALPEK